MIRTPPASDAYRDAWDKVFSADPIEAEAEADPGPSLTAELAIERTCNPACPAEQPSPYMNLYRGIELACDALRAKPPLEIHARLVEWINMANRMLRAVQA